MRAAQKGEREAAGRVAELEGKLAKMKDAQKANEAEWSERLDLVKYDFDDAPGRAAARAAYDSVPAESRPDSLGAFLAGIRDAAHREEDPHAPPWWAAHLAPSAPAAPAQTQRGIRSLQPGSTPPAASGSVSDEALRSLREAAAKSGDNAALMAALRARGAWR